MIDLAIVRENETHGAGEKTTILSEFDDRHRDRCGLGVALGHEKDCRDARIRDARGIGLEYDERASV